MNSQEFKERTKAFALQVIKLCERLPKNGTTNVLSRPLTSCATSVGANYRAACRARSHADFINKMGIVEEECDESISWMELLVDAKLIPETEVTPLQNEATQILSMVVTSIKTARQRS